jgi:molybdopterin/thiamine biosynthesis adenylyltransferase
MDGILNALSQGISPQGAFTLILLLTIIFYIRFLRRMSARARAALNSRPDDAPQTQMSDAELDRYARHIVLREVGGQGQSKLRKSRVFVIGAGGLGSPVLSYLAAAGVGTIGVIDDDTVSLSNLQRQVLFNEDQLGMPKVFAAQAQLAKLNPFITVLPFNRRLTAADAQTLFTDCDLIIDGTDNFETRQMVNTACVSQNIPLLSGAITQWEGQVSLFNAGPDMPCYSCIFPNEPADGLAPDCASAGVIGALPGIIGSMMATEAIKHITGAGQTLSGTMLIFDALYADMRKVKITKDNNCPVCGGRNETKPRDP